MDLPDIRRLLDDERRRLARDGEFVEVLPHVTRAGLRDGQAHWIAWSLLTADTADAAIEAQIAHYRRLGAGFEWKVYAHDGPHEAPRLLDRLRPRGFEVGPGEAVMVYDLAEGLPAAWTARPAHWVERVARAEQVAAYRRVAEAVFGKDYGMTAGQLADAIAAGSTQHLGFVAYAADGEPASVGRLYTHPASAFGGLYGGGTRAEHRGRGFYRALIGARAREAALLGARYLLVDALPTSRPILERMGFEKLTETWPCDWRPEGGGTALP
jgi:hypothetical protein